MLSLAPIFNISINLPSASVQTTNFSLGLILSANTVISTATRLVTYNSVEAMIIAGFSSTSPEVKAATLYFKQTPAPAQIAVGVKGSGETALVALEACRIANMQWYGCAYIGAVTADIEALASYVASASPRAYLFGTTDDSAVIAGTTGNLCLTLQASNNDRVITQYSATADAMVSLMGYIGAMVNQAFTLDFKPEPGVAPDSLTDAQATILQGENCNYFATYENGQSWFANGIAASGHFFDEIFGVDILAADIQSQQIALATSVPSIPQSDAGTQMLTAAIMTACNNALKRGFIAAGTWKGETVLKLTPGTTLPNGYSIQVSPMSTLTPTQLAARQTPPIYVCIIFAGSGQSFTLQINGQ